MGNSLSQVGFVTVLQSVEEAAVGDSKKLRQHAELARRAAGVPTEGGRDADRHLMALAERLDQQAEKFERIERPTSRTRPGT